MKNSATPDFLSIILYWNPSVRTDAAAGQATLSFYFSDQGGAFHLTLEGFSDIGMPGHGMGSFQVVAQ